MDKAAFESHPVWASVTQLNELLAQASERATPDTQDALAAIRYLAAAISSHRDSNDSTPYAATTLNAIHGQLPNVINEVNNFVANGNSGHLTNAQNYADQILHQLGSLPTTALKGGAAAQANRLFAEYRASVEEALKDLQAANEELRTRVAAEQAAHEAAVSTLKGELATMSAQIKSDETRLDTALTTNNEAFTTKQTEREEKFKEFVQEQAAALKSLASDDLDAIHQAQQNASECYKEIDALREGTEKVAGLASADILAGKYSEYSDQQWRWGVGANILGFVTLAVGLGLIAKTLGKVGVDEPVSWQYTTLKLGVTLTIVAASAVAFRLGGVFLSRSSANKRMELELRAIGPFFADIEDAEAVKEAKKAFVARSFGQGSDPTRASESGSQLSSNDAATLLKEVLELVKTVTSKTA